MGNYELTSREYDIMRKIWDLQSDIEMETRDAYYDDGYQAGQADADGAYEEGKNLGYDDGWEDACQHILDGILTQTPFVVTPETSKEVNNLIESEAPAALCVAAVLNYISAQIQKMKVDA